MESLSEVQARDVTVSLLKAKQDICHLSDRRLSEAITRYSAHERNARESNALDDADHYGDLLAMAWDELAYRRKEKRRHLARADA